MPRRAVLIQLARLGDLVQTVPTITALHERHADWIVDLLCPAPLAVLGRMLPGISKVVKWDGSAWHQQARSAEAELRLEHMVAAEGELRATTDETYDVACVLNQHPRAILAGALFARDMIGAITGGPLDHTLSPWATYVRSVAAQRGNNRIHLADAFCGMCGVSPPTRVALIEAPSRPLSADLEPIGQSNGPWIGLLVGAGDQERVVPREVWARLIAAALDRLPSSRIVLIGHEQEQARAHGIQSSLSSSLLGRTWDTTGRLSLADLATVLSRCEVVIGADTGPLHFAAAVGTRVIGWYFARARVHETGPYGPHHWVWQAEGPDGRDAGMIQPTRWPIEETIALVSDQVPSSTKDWSLWSSHRDRWGAYYTEAGQDQTPPIQREQIWQDLQLTAA